MGNERQRGVAKRTCCQRPVCCTLLLAPQVSNGVWFFQLKLSYFDHLMQDDVSAVAVCENPEMPLVPMMACKETEVIVKLPVGTELKRVTTLGKTVVGNLTISGAGAEYVKISTDGNMVWKILGQLKSHDRMFALI